MLIVLGFYRRKAGLTQEQFWRHWRDVHGPLIRSIAVEHPYLVRYVQHHLSSDADYPVFPGMSFDGSTAAYDGFSEGWFVDRQARDSFFALPVFQGAVQEDERCFIDVEATRWVVTDSQHTIICGDDDLVKSYVRSQQNKVLG